MNRRAFIAVIGGALGMRPTSAQQSDKVRTVGVLMGVANDEETEVRTKIIVDGLAQRGWVVGKNLRLDYLFAAGSPDRTLKYAKELVALRPDVIVAHSTPVVSALLRYTHTTPIVFVVVSDPVGSGFVATLARPGGNVTGFSVMQITITGKYLSILRELKLPLTRVALMYNPESVPGGGASYMPAFIQSATQFKVTPIAAEVHSPTDIETAMTGLEGVPGSGLIVMAGNFTSDNRELIVSLAAKLRIPAIYPYRYFVDTGGLLSYGIDVLEPFRRAPDYVDRILRGANPAELPVQSATRFELAINLKTAHALGIVVPRILLAAADVLID